MYIDGKVKTRSPAWSESTVPSALGGFVSHFGASRVAPSSWITALRLAALAGSQGSDRAQACVSV